MCKKGVVRTRESLVLRSCKIFFLWWRAYLLFSSPAAYPLVVCLWTLARVLAAIGPPVKVVSSEFGIERNGLCTLRVKFDFPP